MLCKTELEVRIKGQRQGQEQRVEIIFKVVLLLARQENE